MKKGLCMLVASVFVLSTFSGCAASTSSKVTSGSSSGSSPSNAKVTLNVVTEFGGTDPTVPTYQALIKQFETAYPNITVKDKSATADQNWKSQVINDFSSGSEADVTFFFSDSQATPIIQSGKVVDLSTIQAKYPDYAKNISPAAMSSVKAADGKTYAVPLTGYAEGLFCNKDLFQKEGLSLPKTWDDFINCIKKFKADGIIPIAVGFADVPHYFLDTLPVEVGGSDAVMNPGTDVSKVPSSWTTGFDLIKTLNDDGAFPTNVTTEKDADSTQLFVTGKAAMHLDGSWWLGNIKDDGSTKATTKNTTVIAMPPYTGSSEKPGTILGGFSSGWYISKPAWDSSAKQDAAVKFVEFMSSDASIQLFAQANGGMPASANVTLANPTPLKTDLQKLISDAPAVVAPIDGILTSASFTELVHDAPSIATGQMTGAQAVQKAIPLNTAG